MVYQYDIGSVLSDWESLGVYDFVLPFLLVFAVVYGILTRSNIFSKNKGVNLIISITIALMSLRFGFVQAFYGELWPRFGVAIAVFVVVLILGSIFIPDSKSRLWLNGFAAFGLALGAFTVFKTFNFLGWLGGTGWWYEYGSITILGILLAILIIAIFVSPIHHNPDTHAKPFDFGGA